MDSPHKGPVILTLFPYHGVLCAVSAQALTNDRKDDDDEVEDVPGPPEIMPAESNDFDDGFQSEDGGEDDVDDIEGLRVGLWLAVLLHRHSAHVEQNEDHNSQLELGADRHVKEETLHFVLE